MSAVELELEETVGGCLRQLGVAAGDTLFLHSDALVVAQFFGLARDAAVHRFIDAIEGFLGPRGTLIMPTFTYSFTKGETFRVGETPSTVGVITEIFRQRPGVVRTGDPIFSVAASGAAKDQIGRASCRECLGPGSVFGFLHQADGWILGFGCPFLSTYVHYVEKCFGVAYRYEKEFTGLVVDANGASKECSVSYFVRDLDRKTNADLRRLRGRLQDHGAFRVAALGRVQVWGVRASDFYGHAMALLGEDPASLIEEGVLSAASR